MIISKEVLVIAALLPILASCSESNPLTRSPEKAPPPKVVLCEPSSKEMMPPNSPEFYRLHFKDAQCIETEIQIFYRPSSYPSDESPDGGTAVVKLSGDGKWRSYERKNRKGLVVVNKTFANDGETVINGYRLRDDGSKQLEMSVDSAGAAVIVKYYWDGKAVFMTQYVKTDHSFQQSYLRPNGSLWMKRSGPNLDSATQQEDFDKSGHLSYVRQLVGAAYIETGYRGDGTVRLRRLFPKADTYDEPAVSIDFVNLVHELALVEEFALDGKTVVRRTFIDLEATPRVVEEKMPSGEVLIHKFHPDGQEYYTATRQSNGRLHDVRIDGFPYPVRQETIKADGTKTVRTFNDTGHVLSEETRNAQDKTVSVKKYNPAKDKNPAVESFEAVPIDSNVGGLGEAPLFWWSLTETQIDLRLQEPEE